MATKESIRNRLDWHVNKHSDPQVRSGFLSTLRQSISSIVTSNQYDVESTNNFINKLKIEYFESPYEIKSEEAQKVLHEKEIEHMNRYLDILNIQDNHNVHAINIKRNLKRLRKESK